MYMYIYKYICTYAHTHMSIHTITYYIYMHISVLGSMIRQTGDSSKETPVLFVAPRCFSVADGLIIHFNHTQTFSKTFFACKNNILLTYGVTIFNDVNM